MSDGRRYLDEGVDLQLCREDVLKHWPEQQKKAAAPRRLSRGSKAAAIDLALAALYPSGVPEGVSAKDRNKRVLRWIQEHNKSISDDMPKAVQRGVTRAKNSSSHDRHRGPSPDAC